MPSLQKNDTKRRDKYKIKVKKSKNDENLPYTSYHFCRVVSINDPHNFSVVFSLHCIFVNSAYSKS